MYRYTSIYFSFMITLDLRLAIFDPCNLIMGID